MLLNFEMPVDRPDREEVPILIIPPEEPVILPLPDGAEDPELLDDCPDIDVGIPNRPIIVSRYLPSTPKEIHNPIRLKTDTAPVATSLSRGHQHNTTNINR